MIRGFDPGRDLAEWLAGEAAATAVPTDLPERVEQAVGPRGQRVAFLAAVATPWPSTRMSSARSRRSLAWAGLIIATVLATATAILVGSRLLLEPTRPPGLGIINGPDLVAPCYRHAAVRLADDRVAMFGCDAQVQVLDPDATSWTTDGTIDPICCPGVALLPDGRVLVAGGAFRRHQNFAMLQTAELWDPATGSTIPLPRMQEARGAPILVGLPSGRVLVVGGQISEGPLSSRVVELFDPSANRFTTLPFELPGEVTSAAALPGGTALVVGVTDLTTKPRSPWALIVDPGAATASPIEPPAELGPGQTATALPDGRVVLIGGLSMPDGTESATVQVFDPVTRRFAVTGRLANPRRDHVATATADGNVVVAGGYTPYRNGVPVTTGTIEVVSPDAPATTSLGALPVDRTEGATATLLRDGRILLGGGVHGGIVTGLSSTDLLIPSSP
jgi:hypothetical protein